MRITIRYGRILPRQRTMAMAVDRYGLRHVGVADHRVRVSYGKCHVGPLLWSYGSFPIVLGLRFMPRRLANHSGLVGILTEFLMVIATSDGNHRKGTIRYSAKGL